MKTKTRRARETSTHQTEATTLALLPIPKIRQELRALEVRIARMTHTLQGGAAPLEVNAFLKLVEHLTALRKEVAHRLWSAASGESDGAAGLIHGNCRDDEDLAGKTSDQLMLESLELNERDQTLGRR